MGGREEVAVVHEQAKSIRDIIRIELVVVGSDDFRIRQVTLILVISVGHRRLGSRADRSRRGVQRRGRR